MIQTLLAPLHPSIPSGAMQQWDGALSICFEWRPHSPRGSRERWREVDRQTESTPSFLPSPSITTVDREVMRSSADLPSALAATTTTEFSPTIERRTDGPTAKRPRPMSTPTCAHLTPAAANDWQAVPVGCEPTMVDLGAKYPAQRRDGAYFYFWVLSPSRRVRGIGFQRGERRLIEA